MDWKQKDPNGHLHQPRQGWKYIDWWVYLLHFRQWKKNVLDIFLQKPNAFKGVNTFNPSTVIKASTVANHKMATFCCCDTAEFKKYSIQQATECLQWLRSQDIIDIPCVEYMLNEIVHNWIVMWHNSKYANRNITNQWSVSWMCFGLVIL